MSPRLSLIRGAKLPLSYERGEDLNPMVEFGTFKGGNMADEWLLIPLRSALANDLLNRGGK